MVEQSNLTSETYVVCGFGEVSYDTTFLVGLSDDIFRFVSLVTTPCAALITLAARRSNYSSQIHGARLPRIRVTWVLD